MCRSSNDGEQRFVVKYLLEFFHQKVPKAGTEIPAYYHSALMLSESILALYFLAYEILIYWRIHKVGILPLALSVIMILIIRSSKNMSMRMNNLTYSLVTLVWCGWYVYTFGWASGGQHLLIPMLALNFFNIFNPPWRKIANAAGLIIFRMLLYVWTLKNPPAILLDSTSNIIFQTINSILLFIILSVDFIIFSSSIQDTERELRIDNQVLHKEADTDPLTKLPNRRAMQDQISSFRSQFPDSPFTVAIGDIDFFKKVNDTYGHNCGDYTLQQLADLFRSFSEGNYTVCRWGGEEFCFFMPGKNIDEAWNVMFALCEAVRKMQISFEGNEFTITITIGLEENDFRSSIDRILEKADKKLYMGKVAGRNRVVM